MVAWAVSSSKTLASARRGRERVQTIALGNLLVDNLLEIRQIPGTSTPELLLQSNLQHNIGKV